MNILILHDWCSSINRFVKLKNDLVSDGHMVNVMGLPGLGLESVVWRRDLVGHYSGMVASYLKHNDIGCIIGHGMGAVIGDKALRILATTDKVWRGNFIMVCPFYKGMRKFWIFPALHSFAIPVFKEVIGLTSLLKSVTRTFVRDKQKADDLMMFDIRCVEPEIIISLIDEINRDYWHAVPNTGQTFMICGNADKLVIRRYMKSLYKDIEASDMTWMNCGHYPMVECYEEFLQVVRRYINA